MLAAGVVKVVVVPLCGGRTINLALCADLLPLERHVLICWPVCADLVALVCGFVGVWVLIAWLSCAGLLARVCWFVGSCVLLRWFSFADSLSRVC